MPAVTGPLLRQLPGKVAIVSYRLGGTDGVSIEAAKWKRAFEQLGSAVTTIAGVGSADVLVEGLAHDSTQSVDRAGLHAALLPAELVVVENCCSLPLNPAAGDAIGDELKGRPALLHHHDLSWQRPQFGDAGVPRDDPCWRHVTINERSRIELGARGLRAVTMYNRFDPDPPAGEREATRSALGMGDGQRLLLQPTRAIARKNVAGGLLCARAIGAVYWLLGPAEDGYGPELERLFRAGRASGMQIVHRAPEGTSIDDAYAACDAVVLPSTWEGFGNPAIESALRRRPLAIGPYPVSLELRRYGFSWFSLADSVKLARFVENPDADLLEHNAEIARIRFSTDDLPSALSELLTQSYPGGHE
ncbi:MAG: hypothetical protein ACRDZ5_00645 [Acidimicrobiales bacterium]